MEESLNPWWVAARLGKHRCQGSQLRAADFKSAGHPLTCACQTQFALGTRRFLVQIRQLAFCEPGCDTALLQLIDEQSVSDASEIAAALGHNFKNAGLRTLSQ
jgi:hypothetical protein